MALLIFVTYNERSFASWHIC